MFLWNWQNASGKAETNILLVRFFVVASYGLRAASQSGGFEEGEGSTDTLELPPVKESAAETKVDDKDTLQDLAIHDA